MFMFVNKENILKIMKDKSKRNIFYLLMLILVLALLVRIPGLFFGYHVFGNENVGFLPSEGALAEIALNFLNPPPYAFYLNGFPFQVFLISLLLKLFMNVDLVIITAIGRMISLVYSIASIVLIYFLSKEIFNKKTGMIAALFLSLSGLHVLLSSVSRPDSTSIFWLYATFYFSLLFIRRERLIWLILAIISSGFTASMKMNFINIIPLIYIFLLKKKKIRNALLIIFIFIGAFTLMNGFTYGLNEFFKISDFTLNLNFAARENYNKLANPFMQAINLIVGIGLPVFFFFLISLFAIIKKIKKKK